MELAKIKQEGIYAKFKVERTDGKSARYKKHEHCEYFVLDLTCDKFAAPALRAYAEACKDEYPVLSKELRHKAAIIELAEAREKGNRGGR